MPFTANGRMWLGLAAVICGTVAGPSSSRAAEPPRELPREVLFDPLLADPRWPHFSAAWHQYGGDDALDNVGAVSLGEDFSFYQDAAAGGRWGIGLQAGVFSIFDLDADSRDLVNADYWVGVPLTWRKGPWQGIARVYHQSSHLGDEFLLRTRPRRINLSYEGVDLRLSRYLAGDALRLYGGGGVLVHRIPSDLGRWSVQAGVEYRGPATGLLRPVAALDLAATEEAGWKLDVSARAGAMIESREDSDYRILLALEYFRGRNPNGQFYGTAVDYYGVGVHVYF
ncbi:MAG: DUF1207 domain-containing protein [Pseudomonadota bacterium]